MNADDQYEQQNDVVGGDVPAGDSKDDGYVSRTGQKTHIPVQKDDEPVEDPIDPAKADSDEMLEADDKNAIDQSNVLNDRTRGATKKSGTYAEPGDDEGLPGPEDGTSAIRK